MRLVLVGFYVLALASPQTVRAAQDASASLSVTKSGQITFSIAGETTSNQNAAALKRHTARCDDLAKMAPRVVVRAEAGTPYIHFMDAANWLQDCGVPSLRLIGRSADYRETRAVDIEMPKATDILPPPTTCLPSPGQVANDPICRLYMPARPEMTIVSLRDNGSLDLYVGKRKWVSSIASIAKDIAAEHPSAIAIRERILIRADRNITYEQFFGLVNLLDEGGYSRLALINEDFPPETH